MRKVLFVSHDANLCAAATRVLARAGLEVTVADHGGHALLECLQGEFDTLVIEERLPEGAGSRVVATLRRVRPRIRVVRLSDGPARTNEGSVLYRPFVADDLIAAITGVGVPSGS